MKPKQSTLINQKVRYSIFENELYFAVDDIKALYTNLKFPPSKIKQLPVGGVYANAIRIADVEEMTDFDKKILQTLNFNPKGK